MEITFVRHTSVDVPRGVCYGQTDVGLRDTFPQEAEAVKQQLLGQEFDSAFCSPLSRCRRLAEYCGYGDAALDPRLMEMNFGEWEMKRYEDIRDPRLLQWFENYWNITPTGGENWLEQGERLRSFVASLIERGVERPVVFTHGGIVLHALNQLAGYPREGLFDHLPHYGGIVKIGVSADFCKKI